MGSIVIRPTRMDDISDLWALDTSIPEDTSRADAIASWVRSDECFCAELDGSLVGYAVMHRHFFGRPMLELLMVGRNHRRQGVGRMLIEHAIRSMPDNVLWTSTNQSNLPMQALLARLGFQRSGIIEGLDEGDPELIYRVARE